MSLVHLLTSFLPLVQVLASPAQEPLRSSNRFYDVQAHRGGRGNTVESTLPSFAWGLIDGATTLELDNGITADGVVVVWHDEHITGSKCIDTNSAVPNDPMYPYVGKLIANLTLAQIKTLDCGSKRQPEFPQQQLYPGAQIPTLQEVFDFVECADPSHAIQWNVESKINPQYPNRTAGVQDFVQKQHAIFVDSPYYGSITYQSFDWRTLIAMKELDPLITTSALIEEDTAFTPDNTTTAWLGGIRLDSFPGPSFGEQIAQAAHAIRADLLSPSGTTFLPPFIDSKESHFTTPAMVREAHALGLPVKPWTLNGLGRVEELAEMGVDGIITDYPNVVRRWAKQQGFSVAPKYPKQRVFSCLERHMRKEQLG